MVRAGNWIANGSLCAIWDMLSDLTFIWRDWVRIGSFPSNIAILKLHDINLVGEVDTLSCTGIISHTHRCNFFFLALQPPPPLGGLYFIALYRALASSFSRFLDHTQRRATIGRTPLDEWSVRRRDLYLTTHNTHNRQTSTPRVGFEPTISAGERP